MDDESRDEELRKAGYTGRFGTIVFCTGLAVLGGSLGSLFLAIGFNALFGPEQEESNIWLGTLIGAVTGAALGAFKIREGNRQALAEVEEKSWRRELGAHSRRTSS